MQTKNKQKSLLVIRTPFQAWLVKKIIVQENIKIYDIIYFTHNNSDEDKFYYNVLSSHAKFSCYLFVKPRRRDVLTQAQLRYEARKWFSGGFYDKVFISSISSFLANSLANHFRSAKIITFDDGAANIFSNGIFFNEPTGLKNYLYRKVFRVASLSDFKSKISYHYTIYPDHDNIVESGKVVSLDSGWLSERAKNCERAKVYFIGAPFHEVFNSDQIKSIVVYLQSIEVDYYVRHPRENEPLSSNIPFLEKRGKIAEEAIIDDADGRPVVLIGFLSTVMFNLAECAQRRVILVPEDTEKYSILIKLAHKSGCEIVKINDW